MQLCDSAHIDLCTSTELASNSVLYLNVCYSNFYVQIKAIEDEIALGQIEEVIVICKDELLLVEYYYGKQMILSDLDTPLPPWYKLCLSVEHFFRVSCSICSHSDFAFVAIDLLFIILFLTRLTCLVPD
jgi:hypothetical protein